MRYWRPLLWLMPLATLIPFSVFVYVVATSDFSAYFGDVRLAGLVVFLGVPSLAALTASVLAAVMAMQGRSVAALIIAGGVYVWQLYNLVWAPPFWDVNSRYWYVLLFAMPGVVAGFLALSGLVLLRHSQRAVVVVVTVLLVVPLVTNGAGLATFAVDLARDCPTGPAVDLTFSGLENAHFTRSCGIPTRVSTLVQCQFDDVTVGLSDWGEWFLSVHFVQPYGRTVTSAEFPYLAPRLLVGGNTSYGGGAGWEGTYTSDSENHCAGTIDAKLLPTSGHGGYVHVSGRFEAPLSNT